MTLAGSVKVPWQNPSLLHNEGGLRLGQTTEDNRSAKMNHPVAMVVVALVVVVALAQVVLNQRRQIGSCCRPPRPPMRVMQVTSGYVVAINCEPG